jgi:hypothetical protein
MGMVKQVDVWETWKINHFGIKMLFVHGCICNFVTAVNDSMGKTETP